jgi:hypothetical protein
MRLTLLLTIAGASILCPISGSVPAFALQRKVWDCSRGSCVLNFYSVTFNYTYGRSEGMPARGPVPAGYVPGSTDTDELYDLMPSINEYYMVKFGRNGPNGFGGNSTGVVARASRIRQL